jgi:hypothetical protein
MWMHDLCVQVANLFNYRIKEGNCIVCYLSGDE